jgi:hypothetical protein
MAGKGFTPAVLFPIHDDVTPGYYHNFEIFIFLLGAINGPEPLKKLTRNF